MVQGLIGAALAVAALAIAHFFLAPRLGPLMAVALGLGEVNFLPVAHIVAIAVAGTLLGALGGFMARGRSEA
jgi:hypothetical protein